VAIKTIQLGAVLNPEEQKRLRERLFREARSAGILSHPGIVTIYDVEQQDDLAYIAMEYVDGPTLDHLLSGPQPLTGEQMFGILAQTATALDYAHQKGIVHRDIKPANIMIAGDTTAKIADFGIAKVTASEQFTMTGSIVGTPHYMSPEQVQGQAVDGRSDQFSLAVIAYEMLTGEKPYTGEHLTTVVYKIVAEEPAPPHRWNATLSAPIENVLRQGLAKKPEARFRTCSEFVESLERACASVKGWKTMARGGSLNEPTMGQAPSNTPAVNLPPPRRPRRSEATTTAERIVRRKSNFLPFLLAILMAAALLALIGWQAGPWTIPGSAPGGTSATSPQSRQIPPPRQAPATTTEARHEAKPSPIAPAPVAPPEPKSAGQAEQSPPSLPTAPARQPPEQAAEKPPAKPAPKVAATEAPAELPVRSRSLPGPAVSAQPVTVISSPGGATATLDGRPDSACTTPCALEALPGRHSIAITMPGYQVEHRDVDVGMGPLELPAVVLRGLSGTLMLTSVPSGASIQVNGKATSETTPAQLRLAPGTYRITVEKDGMQSTSLVEIRNGEIRLLKVSLQQ